MLTAVYLRKSRADEDAVSIEDTLNRHQEILLEFAARQPELVISKIYKDVVSGDSLYARPQMLQLLQAAEQDEFDAVLCMDIDRLGRGATSEQGIILETFKSHDIKIITPRKVYDLNNDLDEEYAEFESFMARRELKTIKRRLHNGTVKSLSEGCWLSVAPFGYKNTKVGKKCTLEIFEEEAKYVRMAFDMYASGIGTQSIAHTLNGLGAKPHRSAQFSRSSIAAMLRNQAYIGKVVWNKKKTLNRGSVDKKMKVIHYDKSEWNVYDGIHKPIISEELFNTVNDILSSRYHKPYYEGQIENPLAGLLKCKTCGYGMQRRPFNKKRNDKFISLICQTKGCCASTRIDYVERAVLENVTEKLAYLKANRDKIKAGVDYQPAINSIKKELTTAEKQRGKLQDLLEQGVYDIQTYIDRQKILADRTKALEKELQDLETKQSMQSVEYCDELIKKIENVILNYWGTNAAERNKLLKTIITGGTYFKEKGWSPTRFLISLDYVGEF